MGLEVRGADGYVDADADAIVFGVRAMGSMAETHPLRLCTPIFAVVVRKYLICLVELKLGADRCVAYLEVVCSAFLMAEIEEARLKCGQWGVFVDG